MLKSWFAAVFCVAATSLSGFASADQWDARADQIIANFTTDDLVGQMTQVAIFALLEDKTNNLNETLVRQYAKAKVGSYLTSPFTNGELNGEHGWTAEKWRTVITRIQEITMEENGGHPMIYGIDAAHGSAFVQNTVIFPHQLNAGAAFNTTQVYEMGRITGRDTEAAGIPWVFGPMLEIAQNPLWARNYESYGEDPYLVSVMADAIIRGMQSNKNTAACMKHFIGYSKLPSGHDKDGVTVSDYDLLNYFAPPFISAIKAGVMSGMENYISINGVPTVGNTKIMNDLLRHDMGFNGMMVSDFGEVFSQHSFHRVAKTEQDAVGLTLSHTTLDMSMHYSASFVDFAKAFLEKHPEYLQRVKDSAKRVIKLKLQVGLYDNPVPGADNVKLVGNADDVAHALEAARDSIVLLKNKDNVLPLATSAASSIFLTGHSADNVGYQCGGWSVSWTGDSGNALFPHGISVKQGMEKIVGTNSSFAYFNGLNATGNYTDAELTTAVKMAKAAEYTVAVIGESTYAEKSGDIDNLDLPIGQINYVKALAATGTKVILVLFGGRPRLLNGLPDVVHAVIHGLLPGELGGQALAEILFGKVNPSARLPITYPKDPANIMIPYNHRVSTQCADGTYCKMEWDFGAGLSYTNFTYSPLKLSTTNVTAGSQASVTASVTVTNSGKVAGKETVLLFLTQPFRLISVPEVKQLKKFKKVELQPGESTQVDFTLTTDDWSVYAPQIGQGFKLYAEDADFVVAVKPETDCDVYNTTKTATDPLCATFTLSGN